MNIFAKKFHCLYQIHIARKKFRYLRKKEGIFNAKMSLILSHYWPIFYFIPPKITKKPLVFLCLYGVQNGDICQKWVKKNRPALKYCISYTKNLMRFVSSYFLQKNLYIHLFYSFLS